ncbi:MAG: tetratricopeptide repeat protein [Phycisphaerales bacterium]|nr:MAG: tetratricopeptide repeat protein [Phycisphaerales bacterium]
MNEWFDAERHVERAHELYEAGRWDEAESELREALSLNPFRAEWHFNLGLTLEASGKPEQAQRAFLDAHRLDPEDVQIVMALGVNCLRSERYTDAIEWFERVQRLEPSKAESYVHRIEAYTALNDHDQAETMFYLARQYENEDAQAYANIAESLMDRALHEKAIWCLREAARLQPDLPRVHARLAGAYAATGRQERARQLYLTELREHPGCIDTLLDLGCLLVDMNRLGEASEKFRRVLEIESDNADAHFYLGDLAQRQGQDAEAVASFRVALRLEPDYPCVRLRLAAIALRRNNPADARKHLRAELRDLHRNVGDRTEAELEELGMLLLDAQAARDAQRVFAALLERDSNSAQRHHLHAVSCFLSNDRAKGIESTKTALRHDPMMAPAMHNLALAHYEQGQLSRARHWVQHALTIDPDDASLRRLRTVLRMRAAADVFIGAWAFAAARVRAVWSRRRGLRRARNG